MLGFMGKKIGMTQVFTKEGELVSVTVVQVGPCTVVQRKLTGTDGYNALQLGFLPVKASRAPKARRGHSEKKGLPVFAHLREFRTESAASFKVGQHLELSALKEGDVLDVVGTSKGRGFQGVMKRHGKHGGPASHGSDFHRRPGSIGMRTWPGRVPKNMKLPGHMGCERVTVKGLTVIAVRAADHAVLLQGAVPGARGGLLLLTPQDVGFESRPELRKAASVEGTADISADAAKE
jgi:large subunit ribosomal protein L3